MRDSRSVPEVGFREGMDEKAEAAHREPERAAQRRQSMRQTGGAHRRSSHNVQVRSMLSVSAE